MTPRRTTSAAFVLVAALAATACGDPSESSPSDTAAVADSVAPAETPEEDVFSEPEESSEEPAPEAPAEEPAEAPADESAEAEPAPIDTDASAEPAEAAEPAPVPAPEPEPEVAPAEIGGRALAMELDPAADFEGNPLPNLLVDDVRRGTKVNVRNLLPSELPILLWSFAPH